MHYLSTRDKNTKKRASAAIAQGLAADGGLYTPETIPSLPEGFLEELCAVSYEERAARVMKLYLEEFTLEELRDYAEKAYARFDTAQRAPLRPLGEGVSVLELWHGPTCAFKDMALQMLPYLLTASLRKSGEQRQVCILVATSGDTGKAALEGFRDVPGTRILVFFPNKGVSEIQQLQMTTQQGENVGVCAVEGNFDDAQTGVKKIFSDPALRQTLDQHGIFFSSANSINWGRVLPQIVYYVSAYCDMVTSGQLKMGEKMNVCVPTGNFGNILSAYFAKSMGVPVGKLICASNSNNVLTDFLRDGVYDRKRKFYNTMSPSMDILVSSNLERLLFLLSGQDDAFVSRCMKALSEQGAYRVDEAMRRTLKEHFAGGYCDDSRTARTIRSVFEGKGYLLDPHTAVAWTVYEDYRKETGDTTPTVVVSTASPFKFCDNVLRSLGTPAPDGLGIDIIDQLEKAAGISGPAPLKALRGLPVRFGEVVEKEDMTGAVMRLLGL